MNSQKKLAHWQEQYELEKFYHKELLKECNYAMRQIIYEEAYNTFYSFDKQVNPDKVSYGSSEIDVFDQFFKDSTVVEYGCGHGLTACQIARKAKKVYGADVTIDLLMHAQKKATVDKLSEEFFLVAEINNRVPDNVVDIFYSSNVFEHLHPEDLYYHLLMAYQKLKIGGGYLMITPHAFSGPHDISRKFLPQGAPSQGLHIKEYTYAELATLFKRCGFKNVLAPITLRGIKRLKMTGNVKKIFINSNHKIFFEKCLPKYFFINKKLSKMLGISSVCVFAKK